MSQNPESTPHTVPLSLHPGGIALTRAAANAAGMQPGDSVLDLGCGTCASLEMLRDEFGIIPCGVDISDATAKKAAARYPSINVIVADVCDLPVDDRSYDHVMLECVISLLDDPHAALNEAVRVLRPGGDLIISTLTGPNDADHTAGLVSLAELESHLTHLGMDMMMCEDHTADLTQYMIDSIMEYGGLEERIRAESELTGITGTSIYNCSASTYDLRTTGYYLVIFRKRRGTPVDHLVAERIGITSEQLTQDAVESYQINAFRRTMRYAMDRSRFYSNLLEGIDPDNIHSMEDIKGIPSTCESDLAGNEWQFQCIGSSAVDRKVTIPVLDQAPQRASLSDELSDIMSSGIAQASTTGTSGSRKRISYTAEDQARSIEFINRGFLTMNCTEGEKMIIYMSGTSEGSIGDLVARAMEPLRMDIRVYGAVTDIADAYDALMDFRPGVVEAIPWHAAALARYGSRYGNPEKEFIRSVNLSADVVPDAIVRRLEQLWGCTVHRHYGTTEMAIFGGVECIHHQGYHTRPCDILYEIPDTDDNGYGELLITTLDRKAMPLIRYRTGDIARFIDTPCPCGCTIRRIERFLGRKSSLITLTQGSFYLSELAEILYSIPEVIDFDAFLNSEEGHESLSLTIRTLPGETADETLIRSNLQTLIHADPEDSSDGSCPEIRFEETSSFPGGYNLKKKVIRV